MHKIRVDYLDRKNNAVTSIYIVGESETGVYGRLYKVREMLDKEKYNYIVFAKDGFFSRYKRLYTINDLK